MRLYILLVVLGAGAFAQRAAAEDCRAIAEPALRLTCYDKLNPPHKNRRLSEQKGESAAWERRLFDRLTDFLDGFKEVRLNAARSDDLFADALDVSKTAANIKIRTQAETNRSRSF